MKTFGSPQNPAVLLLHGGGLSWWSYEDTIRTLEHTYYLIVPVLDGHGEAAGTPFISIKHCADKLIEQIDALHGGRLYAIAGLSLGAQVAVAMLSARPDICQKAWLESALVYPMPAMQRLAAPLYRLLYPLTQSKRFAAMQGKALFLCGTMLEQYIHDSVRMTRTSLIAMTLSNAAQQAPQSLINCQAEAAVVVGEKELPIMKRSATRLCALLPRSKLMVLRGKKHGQLPLQTPTLFTNELARFLSASQKENL